MADFNVVTISPENYEHSDLLHEWNEVLTDGFQCLGHEAVSTFNTFCDDRINVIFGAHLMTERQRHSIPSGSVIVNLEPLADTRNPADDIYIELLKNHVVWDYSKANVQFLRQRFGIQHAQYLPVSYSPRLSSHVGEQVEPDIDILFYGSINDRRRKLLERLSSAGLNVQVLVGVYGKARDEYIARSKVVLSIAFYEVKILESTRIMHALAHGRSVVAECYSDSDYDKRFDGAALMCSYDQLFSECIRLVSDEGARAELESRASGACDHLHIKNTLVGPLGAYSEDLQRLSSRQMCPDSCKEAEDIGEVMRLLLQRDDLFGAEAHAIQIIASTPADAEAWNVIGAAEAKRGNLDSALTAFKCVATLQPESAIALENLARVQLASGLVEDALIQFEAAFDLAPLSLRLGETYLDLLNREGRHQEVLTKGEALLAENPRSAVLMLFFARAFKGLEDVDTACRFYLAALALNPDNGEISTELSIYFFENGRIKDALAFYADAIERNEYDASAYHGLGTCYQFMGDFDTALECYEQVVRLEPDMPGTLRNLSYVYHVLQRPREAVQAIARVVALDPTDMLAAIQLAYYSKHICDWSNPIDPKLFSDFDVVKGASPFQVLSMVDDPLLQLELSRNFQVDQFVKYSRQPFSRRENKKIRVGFFGSDFHDHATMVLMSGLFREYDRDTFEFYVYSYGVKQSGAYRESLESQVDVFRNVLGATDKELHSIGITDNLDVAVDLKGFTSGGRLKPFEWGLAPIQVSYLGYPGTLGRDCFDYMIADEITVPPELQNGYSEKMMLMPYSYQPNVNQRQLHFIEDKRSDHGLPERGFVFCCFNNNYKISAAEFDIWMRLLRAADGSVLWLLDANPDAKKNLRLEAQKRGVSPDRLVFAPRAAIEDHLSRHQHADLFLDTFNVNAHTTATDSLWAGLPVLTLQGEQFAARVASSLLDAVGMPELITKSEQEYEGMALQIATDANFLKRLKAKLRDAKGKKPLFDTEAYARAFEALMIRAVSVEKRAGSEPRLAA